MATPEDVTRLAALARLSIPADTLPAIAAEFDSILTYIGQLDELSLESEGTPHVPENHNAFRIDGNAQEAGAWTETVTKQFPQREGNSLAVKQILNHD